MLVVSGFSQSTGMPRSRQARTCASCAAPGVAMTTASTSSASMASNGSATTREPGMPAETFAAVSAEKSLITVTVAPLTAVDSVLAWYEPIMPTPRTATRRSSDTVILLQGGEKGGGTA